MYLLTLFSILLIVGIVFFLFRGKKRPPITGAMPARFNGPHDCGIRALLNVLPDLNHDELHDAFMNCTENWPYKGITDREFNITLRHLGIYDKFEFISNIENIGQIRRDKKHSYIALIGGHYTVICRGRTIDRDIRYDLPENTKVYSCWKLAI